jgi:DNA-binding NarL/FixJ family response regulator
VHDAPQRPAVVVLTSATDDEHLVRAMRAGATSYLLKTAPAKHVIAAVRGAATGSASLSPELLTTLTQALRRPPPSRQLRAPAVTTWVRDPHEHADHPFRTVKWPRRRSSATRRTDIACFTAAWL